MSPTRTNGFLVLADISGYSQYLGSTDLENAPVVLGDVL